MRELTLTSFQQLCDRFSPSKYIYDTDNQIEEEISDIRMLLFFTKTVVSLAPNCICFQGDGGTLRLDRVKTVRMAEGFGGYDIVFYIVCGNLRDDKEDKTYVVTAKIL